MTKENILEKKVHKFVKTNLFKGLVIGIAVAIVLGASIGIPLYLNNSAIQPNGGNGFVTGLAQDVKQSVPNVVRAQIAGNFTSAIHPNLGWAFMDRIGDNTSYEWNVTAYTGPEEFVQFILDTSEVDQIAQSLFDSINQTEQVEEPEDKGNIYWAILLTLEDDKTYELGVLNTEYIMYNIYDNPNLQNRLEEYILTPASAFEHIRVTLSELFNPYLD